MIKPQYNNYLQFGLYCNLAGWGRGGRKSSNCKHSIFGQNGNVENCIFNIPISNIALSNTLIKQIWDQKIGLSTFFL